MTLAADEHGALAAQGAPYDDTSHGSRYKRSLGDLIVDALAPGLESWCDGPEYPEDWQTFLWLFNENTALELRCLVRAFEAGDVTTDDDPLSETFEDGDVARMLNIIRRRMEAAGELAIRLRKARWGNPHFGGGEGMKAEPVAATSTGARTEGS